MEILIVASEGYSGSNLTGGTGMYHASTPVSSIDNTYYKKIHVGDDVYTGRYIVMVLIPGSDGVWGKSGYSELYNPNDPGDPDTALGQYPLTTRTQDDMLDIVEDLIFFDDFLWLLSLSVESPYVGLDPIADVTLGEPIEVSGTTIKEKVVEIVITAKGPVELTSVDRTCR